jgi:hypothetical protein
MEKPKRKPPKRKPGPAEERLVITEDPESALSRLLKEREPRKDKKPKSGDK